MTVIYIRPDAVSIDMPQQQETHDTQHNIINRQRTKPHGMIKDSIKKIHCRKEQVNSQ